MKRTNGVRATYNNDAFLLHVLQAVLGCAANFSTLKEPCPWPSIVLYCFRLASYAEVHY